MKAKIYKSVWFFVAVVALCSACKEKESINDPYGSENVLLYVNSKPSGMAIYVDGINIDQVTPDTVKGLNPGTYTISLVSECFDEVEYIKVLRENSFTEIFCDYTLYEKNFGNLIVSDVIRYETQDNGSGLIRTWPEEVSLFLNDTLLSVTPPCTLKLLAGNYILREDASEHRPDIKEVFVERGTTSEILLEPQDTSVCVDFYYDNLGIPSLNTSYVTVDHNGVIWFGSQPGGVTKYENGMFTTFDESNSLMVSTNVNCITVDEDNNKWIGTEKGMLKLSSDGQWELFSTANINIPSENIIHIAADNNGVIWFSIRNPESIYYLAKLTDHACQYWKINNHKITCLAVDSNSLLWLGMSRGLSTFDGNEFSNPQVAEIHQELTYRSIHDLLFDRDGNLWLVFDSGWDGRRNIFAFDGQQFFFKYSLSAPSDLYLDMEGDIWISNLDWDELPLPDNYEERILIKYDSSLREYNYYSEDQIRSPTIIFNNLCRHPNGDLWIATSTNGILKVKYNKIENGSAQL